MAGNTWVRYFVNQYITKDVYSSIVKNLNGRILATENNKAYGTVLDNPGPTSFSFEIEYETDSSDSTMKKKLVGKVISNKISDTFRPIFCETHATDGLLTQKVLGPLNKHLESAKCELLRYPQLHYARLDKPRYELLVFEDITADGFKLHDYATVLTLDESKLVMKAYAKLHAGSILVNNKEGLTNLYPELRKTNLVGLERRYLDIDNSLKEMLKSNLELLENVEGQQKNMNWIREIKNEPLERFHSDFKNIDKFTVVNHGSIGENLLYFRTKACKEAVSFSSFGGAKMGSAAVDINNFLFMCLDSQMREQKKQLLQVYYDHLEYILRKGKLNPPFTLHELEKEVNDKAASAIFPVIQSLPRFIGGPDYANKISLFNSTDMKDYNDIHRQNLQILYENNPVFKKRFVEIFNDLSEIVTV